MGSSPYSSATSAGPRHRPYQLYPALRGAQSLTSLPDNSDDELALGIARLPALLRDWDTTPKQAPSLAASNISATSSIAPHDDDELHEDAEPVWSAAVGGPADMLSIQARRYSHSQNQLHLDRNGSYSEETPDSDQRPDVGSGSASPIPQCQQFFRSGKCQYGQTCKYLHVQNPKGASKAATKKKGKGYDGDAASNSPSRTRRDIESGRSSGGSTGSSSSGSISGSGGNPVYPVRESAADCQYYLKTGKCNYGGRCKFNHPVRPEKLVTSLGRRDCFDFVQWGVCPYGKACKYNHPLPDTAANRPSREAGAVDDEVVAATMSTDRFRNSTIPAERGASVSGLDSSGSVPSSSPDFSPVPAKAAAPAASGVSGSFEHWGRPLVLSNVASPMTAPTVESDFFEELSLEPLREWLPRPSGASSAKVENLRLKEVDRGGQAGMRAVRSAVFDTHTAMASDQPTPWSNNSRTSFDLAHERPASRPNMPSGSSAVGRDLSHSMWGGSPAEQTHVESSRSMSVFGARHAGSNIQYRLFDAEGGDGRVAGSGQSSFSFWTG